ncbi:MAG: hypothetical protein K0S38_636 [Candidatus Paceibacter sp.]|nr:hypothetical protein [Candidatus Paceibacter sp.]
MLEHVDIDIPNPYYRVGQVLISLFLLTLGVLQLSQNGTSDIYKLIIFFGGGAILLLDVLFRKTRPTPVFWVSPEGLFLKKDSPVISWRSLEEVNVFMKREDTAETLTIHWYLVFTHKNLEQTKIDLGTELMFRRTIEKKAEKLKATLSKYPIEIGNFDVSVEAQEAAYKVSE